MESLFQNTTLLDKDVYYEFNRFHFNSSKMHSYARLILLACGIFLIAMSLFYFMGVIKGDGISVFGAGLFCVIYGLFFQWLIKWLSNRQLKSDKRLQTPKEVEYTFEEDCLRLSYEEGDGTFKYDNLYKVSESDAYFYLYINLKMAYIVGKSGFTSGTPEQFRDFMMGKMGKKFYNRAKKQ